MTKDFCPLPYPLNLGKTRENTEITKESPCLKLTKEFQKTKERKGVAFVIFVVSVVFVTGDPHANHQVYQTIGLEIPEGLHLRSSSLVLWRGLCDFRGPT